MSGAQPAERPDPDSIGLKMAETITTLMLAFIKETERGKACVGDAILDDEVKQLCCVHLVADSEETSSLMRNGEPLGSHGQRLKLAYCLGWLGIATYQTCRDIHRIRNRMA